MMKILSIMLIVSLILPSVSASTFLTEKAEIAEDADWGAYTNVSGIFFVLLDGEPYNVTITPVDDRCERTILIENEVPESYDYKIITTTKNAEKWWVIAEYYFETGEFTFKQKYITIPWLYLNTPIIESGTEGNIAFAVQSASRSFINII